VVGGTNHERALQPAAQTAYRLNFPHYNLPNTTADGLGAVYHTFSVGRVKFIVIDTRAEQFRAIPQIISPHQMAWLKNELNDFASWGLVVLVSSQPWIGGAEPGVSQAWNGYPAQREELANHIATIGVNNMIFIAGDAHMVRPHRHSYDSRELLNLTCLLYTCSWLMTMDPTLTTRQSRMQRPVSLFSKAPLLIALVLLRVVLTVRDALRMLMRSLTSTPSWTFAILVLMFVSTFAVIA
jgi:hypothetical protein